jgi:hypothetical protein
LFSIPLRVHVVGTTQKNEERQQNPGQIIFEVGVEKAVEEIPEIPCGEPDVKEFVLGLFPRARQPRAEGPPAGPQKQAECAKSNQTRFR